MPRFGIGGKDRGKEVFEEIIQAGLGPSQQEASSAAARMVTSLRVFSPSETSKAAGMVSLLEVLLSPLCALCHSSALQPLWGPV